MFIQIRFSLTDAFISLMKTGSKGKFSLKCCPLSDFNSFPTKLMSIDSQLRWNNIYKATVFKKCRPAYSEVNYLIMSEGCTFRWN